MKGGGLGSGREVHLSLLVCGLVIHENALSRLRYAYIILYHYMILYIYIPQRKIKGNKEKKMRGRVTVCVIHEND